MSHEGIRFISEDELRSWRRRPRIAICPKQATEPARVRVQKTTGTGMEIDWRTATKSSWNLPGYATPALAPPATKSAEHLAGSLGNPSLSRQHCCQCTRRGRGRSRSPRLAAMHQFSLE